MILFAEEWAFIDIANLGTPGICYLINKYLHRCKYLNYTGSHRNEVKLYVKSYVSCYMMMFTLMT